MIARIRLLLPSYIGMLVSDGYNIIQVKSDAFPEYSVVVYPPIRVEHRFPDPFMPVQINARDIIGLWRGVSPKQVVSGIQIEEKEHWWANCMVLDFHGETFPKEHDQAQTVVRHALDLVDPLLRYLRVKAHQSYIRPFPAVAMAGHATPLQVQYLVEYLDDDMQILPKSSGYRRRGTFQFAITSGAVTPQSWKDAWNGLTRGDTVTVQEELLVDAENQVPEVRAIITAYSSLEIFIKHYVEMIASLSGKDDSFWKWIIDRDNDHQRQPSVKEYLDQLLFYVSGRSLKGDRPDLWEKFQRLRKARNDLVHRGSRTIQASGLGSVSAMVSAVQEIIHWVEDPKRERETAKIEMVISLEQGVGQPELSLADEEEPPNHTGG